MIRKARNAGTAPIMNMIRQGEEPNIERPVACGSQA